MEYSRIDVRSSIISKLLRQARGYFLLAVLAFFFALASISGPTGASEKMQNPVLKGSLNGYPTYLDPARIIDSAQWHTLINLGINLVSYDRSGRLVGDGATKWGVSSDFREFTFTLDPKLKSSKGRALDSEDWKATFLHLLRAGGSTHSFIVEFLDEQGVQAEAPNRLKLSLKKPYKTLLQRLATPEFILLPRESIGPSNQVNLSISSGAYYVADLNLEKQYCLLRANPHSSRIREGVIQEIQIVPRPKTNVELLEGLALGNFHFTIFAPIPTDQSAQILKGYVERGKIRAHPTETSATAFVLFRDTARLAGTKPKHGLAKVLGLAAEKELNGLAARSAHQMFPESFLGALTPVEERRIFSAIGASRDSTLPKHLIGYGSTGGFLSGVPQWVKKTLEASGINTDLREMPYTEYQKQFPTMDHDFVVVITGMNSKDPAGSLATLLSPKSGIIPDLGGRWSAKLQEAVEADDKKRAGILSELGTEMVQSGTIVPLFHFGTTIISAPNVDARPPSLYDDGIRLDQIRWNTPQR